MRFVIAVAVGLLAASTFGLASAHAGAATGLKQLPAVSTETSLVEQVHRRRYYGYGRYFRRYLRHKLRRKYYRRHYYRRHYYRPYYGYNYYRPYYRHRYYGHRW